MDPNSGAVDGPRHPNGGAVTGLAAGLYPAIQANRIEPAEALRQ
jgi:hypothetical protein